MCVVALQALICLGAGLVSVLLPDDPNLPPGYYDGDDDDPAATPERLDSAVALVVDTTGGRLPIQVPASPDLTAPPVSPPRPAAAQSPLLRSPPASA
jgi:hypothetical protein